MRSAILFSLLTFSVPLTAFSQGLYTDSGFGVEAHARDAGGAIQYGADFGYVMRGNLEFGLGLTQTAATSLNGQGLNVWDLAPSARFYALKATSNMPVSVSASAGFALRRYSGSLYDNIKDSGGQITAHALSAGLEMNGHARLANKVQLVPTLSFSLERWTETFKFEGRSESNSATLKYLEATLPLAISLEGNNTIHLGPNARLDIFDGGTMATFGARAGMVFGR